MTRLDLRKQRKMVISGNPGISFLLLRNKSDMPEVLYTLKSKKNIINRKIGSIRREDNFNSHNSKIFVY